MIVYHKYAHVKKSGTHLHEWIWSDFQEEKQSAKAYILCKKEEEIRKQKRIFLLTSAKRNIGMIKQAAIKLVTHQGLRE